MALHSSRYQLQLFIPAATPSCIPPATRTSSLPPAPRSLAQVFPQTAKRFGWSGAEQGREKIYREPRVAVGLLLRPACARGSAKS